VSNRLFYYAGARYWNYDGDYTNVVDGRPAGAQKTTSGTLKFLWTPAENFEATLLATKSQDDDEGALALGLQGREFNNCQLRVISGTAANNFAGSVLPRSPGYYCGTVLGASDLPVQQRTDVMTDPGLDRDSLRLALTTNTTFAGGYTLTTVSAYHDEDQESQIDVSYAAYDPFVQTVAASQAGAFWRQGAEEREDFAQELRLDSPQDRRLRWRVGGYYFKGNDDTIKDNKYTPVGFAVTPSPANACAALPRGNFLCPNGQATLAERSIENRAVFGDIEFDFTDQWTVTAEVRRAKEEAEQLNQNVLPPFCNPAIATNTPGLTINGCRFAGEWTSTTPRFTLRYKMTPDATFYFNAAKGNKPGGFNSASAVQVGINTGVPVKAAYDEEESKAYELGAKLSLLDGRASFNVAAFFTDLTGQQLTSNIVGILNGNAVLNSFIANIGATEIKGLEIESALQITSAWDAQLTLSYVNSKVTEFFDNNQVALTSPSGPIQTTPSTLGPVTLCNQRTGTQVPGRPFCDDAIAADLATYGDVAGAYSPRTPKVQASLSSSYKGEFDNGLTWRLSGDVSYEGSKYGQVDNFSKTGAHTYVGLRFGLSSESWDLTLWGKNIFDDDAALDILRYIDTRAITAAQFNTPALGRITPRGFVLTYPRSRQFGATLSFKF
jgi:outer membrane receptor protein involved in Fe transport